MIERIVFDIKELEKTFRIVNGKLERVDLRCKQKEGKWKEVANKANDGGGYCQVGFRGRLYMYHVILWELHYNEKISEGFEIDHINGDRTDNRIGNLRLVTHRENQQNMEIHRKGKLVSCLYRKDISNYQARVKINNKRIHIGYFSTEEEAHEAYEIACKHLEEYVDNASFREMVKQELSVGLGENHETRQSIITGV